MKKRKDQKVWWGLSGNRVNRGGRRNRYPFTFRLKAVKLHLEEGYSLNLIAQELGCTGNSVKRWVDCYEDYGEEGLKNQYMPKPRPRKVSSVVDEKILELRRENPQYGPRRISDILRRMFLLKASPSTVHRRLTEADMIGEPGKKKAKKNPAKPRFFERTTPNQLWQSDIMSFRLKDKAVYLIGFIDDYSRYIVGLGLYRAQTAEAVLETYRRAVGDYGVPREMLTDNGRQYVSWRGNTKFQKEMAKDKIKHIRSRPAHPMTLGKLERFWKCILTEFLNRARFEDFEEARERIALWIKYYNHRRPHQGIGSLCPADRFYEINHSVKQALDERIEENVLELALRGKPAQPFYMVGRMGDQSVEIRAEKGKVRMLLDGKEPNQPSELTYEIERAIHDNIDQQQPGKEIKTHLHGGTEDARRAGSVDRSPPALPDSARVGDYRYPAGPVAEKGDEGDFSGHGASQERSGEGPAATASGEHPDPADTADPADKACEALRGGTGCEQQSGTGGEEEAGEEENSNIEKEVNDGDHGGEENAQAGRSNPQGPVQDDEGSGCGQGTGGRSQDLLQVGEQGDCSPQGILKRQPRWSPIPAGGSEAKAVGGAEPPAANREPSAADEARHPEGDGRGASARAPNPQVQGL